MQSRSSSYPAVLLLVSAVVLIWSAIHPHDFFTWILEVFPAIIAAAILIPTYHRFRFTPLVYTLIAIHAIILIVGGHYTYAEVPLGNWVRDAFHQTRNNYDKLGHFAQGFVPAMVAREVLLRKTPLKRGAWLSFIVVSICLAISALYELFEWGTAALTGTAAEAFLGMQGDVWDTQKDMLTALIGAIVAVVTMSRWQDSQMRSSNETEE